MIASAMLLTVFAARPSLAQNAPVRLPPVDQVPSVDLVPPPDRDPAAEPPSASDMRKQTAPLDWWNGVVSQPIFDWPKWVTFDLDTVLLDTLGHSPRIQSVSHRTSATLENIVQQDAAFDANMLLESKYGHTNDPVGNSLVTGGPPRLREQSLINRAGIQRTRRNGTVIDLSQELGLRESNSLFFDPENQGNARLSLSLTKPLYAGSGRVYNERLLTQARIDGRVSWQEMRGDVERRIADVISAYWRLYEARCHLLQQTKLLERGLRIERIIEARRDFDSGRIEIATARQRVARRQDRIIRADADVRQRQTRLATLIGSEALLGADSQLEMIPAGLPLFPDQDWDLRGAVLRGIENRPEVRASAEQLESAALSIRVTRNELMPQLNAVVESYLAGLNGGSRVFDSWWDQFTQSGPGVTAGLVYEMPYGQRAARSRYRQAHQIYRQRSEELRDVIQETQMEIETALIEVKTASAQQQSKRLMLTTAIEEEEVLTRRWEMMGGDGGRVGLVLENLLDAQQRRADAEREWVTSQANYVIALVEMQRAMGTLLIHEGIFPTQHHCEIEFIRDQTVPQSDGMILSPEMTTETSTIKMIEAKTR